MDLQRTKRLLDKINALHTSIGLDNHVNSIERDLMLSYVRQFYDACLAESADSMPVEEKPVPKPKPKPKARKVMPPPVVEPAIAPPPPVVVEAPAPPPPPPPKPAPAPAPAPVVTKAKLAPSIAALFQHQAAKELSEKLSQQRITDLTKAMSINDKLLYANELFGRDMAGMNSVLQEVNTLSDMDAAQAKLGEIAATNDWANDERADIARSFIKLVRRKFG